MDAELRSVGRRAAVLAAATAAALAAAPSGAVALPTPRPGVEAPPVLVAIDQASRATASYFKVHARPGRRTAAGRLLLRNPTGRRVVVALDKLDAQTATTLGSAYDVRGLQVHAPAIWLRFGHRRVVLPPHGRRALRVSVAVPAGAAPGQYLGGIGVQVVGRRATMRRGALAIASVQRYAIGVEIALPGPRDPRIVLDSARAERQPSGLVFLVHGRNPGNVILTKVTGRMLVTQGDRRVATATVGPGTFVTGTAIDFPVAARREAPTRYTTYRVRGFMRYRGGIARIDTLVPFGERQATAQQRYGGPKATPDRPGPPWAAIVAALAILLGGTGLLVALRRRRPRARLARVLAAATRERPVGVLVVDVAAEARPAALATVRERVGRRDVVADLGEDGLVVAAPDAEPEDTAELADLLARGLERANVGARVVGATIRRGLPVAAALERAREGAISGSRADRPDEVGAVDLTGL